MALQVQEAPELEVYLVEVDILRGSNLPAKDIDGKSDPKIKIKIGGQEDKTKVIRNNLNPVFNEKFRFKFLSNPQNIRFNVVDKDLTSEDKIGFVEYDLNALFNSDRSVFDGTLELRHDNKKAKVIKGATIQVKIMAKRFLPLQLEKKRLQQAESLGKQSVQIRTLTEKVGTLQRTVDDLQSSLDRQLQVNQRLTASMQERSKDDEEDKSSMPELPTKRQQFMNRLGAYKSTILDKTSAVIIQVYAVWQLVLMRVVYGIPYIGYYIDLAMMLMSSLLRLQVGGSVFAGVNTSKRPSKLLKLYEYESNVECKQVREMLCALDLDCVVYPCPLPKSADDMYLSRFGEEAKRLMDGTGKELSLPLLVDDNYQHDGPLVMTGGAAICQYLMQQYGQTVKMSMMERLRMAVVNNKVSMMLFEYGFLMLFRGLPQQGRQRMGNTVKPRDLLELWSYEPSPFCIKVREVLSSLELPYVLKNVAVKSAQKRQEFRIRFGKMYPKWRQKLNLIQVPCLIDSNTGRTIFQSEDIKKYLIKTYSTEY